jgi:hypothetical protein
MGNPMNRELRQKIAAAKRTAQECLGVFEMIDPAHELLAQLEQERDLKTRERDAVLAETTQVTKALDALKAEAAGLERDVRTLTGLKAELTDAVAELRAEVARHEAVLAGARAQLGVA